MNKDEFELMQRMTEALERIANRLDSGLPK